MKSFYAKVRILPLRNSSSSSSFFIRRQQKLMLMMRSDFPFSSMLSLSRQSCYNPRFIVRRNGQFPRTFFVSDFVTLPSELNVVATLLIKFYVYLCSLLRLSTSLLPSLLRVSFAYLSTHFLH